MHRFDNSREDCQNLEQGTMPAACHTPTPRWLLLCKGVALLIVIILLTIIAATNLHIVSLSAQMSAEYSQMLTDLESSIPKVKYSSTPEGQPVWGVALLDSELYVLRHRADELEVYDTVTYTLQRRLAVPALHVGNDITADSMHHCIYVTDLVKDAIHRVTKDGGVTSFGVEDGVQGLSVNSAGNVLVTLREPSKVVEYTTLGQLVREIMLPADIVNATHVVELVPGTLAVGHGSADSPFHRICLVTDTGSLVKCYPGNVGTSLGQLHYPVRLASARGQLLVDDLSNDQILLLNQNLVYQYDVISRYDGLRSPVRMHYDAQTNKLFVADNDVRDDVVVSGNVKIFTLQL